MAEVHEQPWIGIPIADLVAALAALEAVPNIDRRILRLEVTGKGDLKVLTGHSTADLNAELTEVALHRDGDGWHATVLLCLSS